MENREIVSIKTAKMLKDAGYDGFSYDYIKGKSDKICHSNIEDCFNNRIDDDYVAIPSFYSVQAWLRIKYGIHIDISVGFPYDFGQCYFYFVYVVKDDHIEYPMDSDVLCSNSYEDTLENAIVYTIENLEIFT